MKRFRKRYSKRSYRKKRYISNCLTLVPRGTQYSIETLNCTAPFIFPGGLLSLTGAEIPTNLMWQNIIGVSSFPNFERYKLLSVKVKFIPAPAFWNSNPQTDGSPPFFGGIHMCSFHTDQTGAAIDLNFINKYKDARHYDPHNDRNMSCYWRPNKADSAEQEFKPLPLIIQAADFSHGGIRIVCEGTNLLGGDNPATTIGEFQVTFKIILIGKLSTSFNL